MLCLKKVKPSPEQLKILSRSNSGPEVLRGAAGSGKTTTAIIRLRSHIGRFIGKRQRENNYNPIKVAVFTFNRTLKGYVEQLVSHNTPEDVPIEVTVTTHGKWAKEILGSPQIASDKVRERIIAENSRKLSKALPLEFLNSEVEYILNRFGSLGLDEYLTCHRDGRGGAPRVDRSAREEIVELIIRPYLDSILESGSLDWSQISERVQEMDNSLEFDIVIVDEAQDFSAVQIKSIMRHVAHDYVVTFVLDTAQRIYARGFTWKEVGISVGPGNSFQLSRNYRNTKEIAEMAKGLIEGLPAEEDFSLPTSDVAQGSGMVPRLLNGKFSSQVQFAIDYIQREVDLSSESVAFVHRKGGRWFDYLKSKLSQAGLDWEIMTRRECWPEGDCNIGLLTMHSSKGLEFDHVFLLGISSDLFNDWDSDDDHRLIENRKLLAMSIGRAVKTVHLGAKRDDSSEIVGLLKEGTFELIDL
ncbi:MAG: 3'-5' exonuclease [Flavobacteriaceae bacterium]